ncbi:uncharacterized protein LOC118433258 [Folsomia candida]|uniref:uncharacterized protein LOC118433258 n=1 Tax=Folsomia candida TaxID=158441 RepID=UPI0016055AB3|nr:uncharacterized protein LOC118433258 [Folsomia candida]
MRTLQILSTAISSKRQQQRLLGTYSETSPSVSVPCPKCHTQVVVTSKILEDAKKPRNKGLQNIRNVEIELRARGQELPAWMKAYREGKMMDAAKLVHEHYVARKNSASTSNVAVQEATTSSSEQGPPSTVGPEENGPTQEKTEKRSNSE